MGVPSKKKDCDHSEPDGDEGLEKRVGKHLKRRGNDKDPKPLADFIKNKKAAKKE